MALLNANKLNHWDQCHTCCGSSPNRTPQFHCAWVVQWLMALQISLLENQPKTWFSAAQQPWMIRNSDSSLQLANATAKIPANSPVVRGLDAWQCCKKETWHWAAIWQKCNSLGDAMGAAFLVLSMSRWHVHLGSRKPASLISFLWDIFDGHSQKHNWAAHNSIAKGL